MQATGTWRTSSCLFRHTGRYTDQFTGRGSPVGDLPSIVVARRLVSGAVRSVFRTSKEGHTHRHSSKLSASSWEDQKTSHSCAIVSGSPRLITAVRMSSAAAPRELINAEKEMAVTVEEPLIAQGEEDKHKPTPFNNEKGEPNLYTVRVQIKRNDGKSTELNAVYQDTMPEGSSIGTAVMMHGTPGSHNDFKYVQPELTKMGIRTIGINYPGFGYSQDDRNLHHTNTERNSFVETILGILSLSSRIVFVGHSRGTENALMMTSRNPDKAVGTVMINPTGLRIHRGCRPFWFFTTWCAVYDVMPRVIQRVFEWPLQKMFQYIGFREKDGRVCAVAMHALRSLSLHKQAPCMLDIQRPEVNTRLLFCYSGEGDWIIEPAVSKEYEEIIQNRVHVECLTDDNAEEAAVTKTMTEAFSSGERRVAAYFHTDNHFLQKHRAAFIAQGIQSILVASSSDSKN